MGFDIPNISYRAVFLIPGQYLNKFGRGLHGGATYQILRLCARWFQTRMFKGFGSDNLFLARIYLVMRQLEPFRHRKPYKDNFYQFWVNISILIVLRRRDTQKIDLSAKSHHD